MPSTPAASAAGGGDDGEAAAPARGRPPDPEPCGALRTPGRSRRAVRELRAALFDRAEPVAAADIAAYERALHAADRMADDLAADAARVAEQAADRQRLAGEQEEEAAARHALAEVEAEAAEGLASWREAWAPAGIVPTTPAEMAAWLGEAVNLIESQQVLESRRNEVESLTRRIASCRVPLCDLARRAGLDDADGLEPGLLLPRLDDHITLLAGLWETRREAQATLRAAGVQLARLQGGP